MLSERETDIDRGREKQNMGVQWPLATVNEHQMHTQHRVYVGAGESNPSQQTL